MRPHWLMLREWDAIRIQPLSDEAKRHACRLGVLRGCVERMAAATIA